MATAAKHSNFPVIVKEAPAFGDD
jgi:hypothetical protein